MSHDRQAAAIVGMGLVTPLGRGVDAHFAALLAGDVARRPLDRFPVDDLTATAGGQLPPELENRLRGDDDLADALIREAAVQALGAIPATADPRLGLVLGTNFGCLETLEWAWRERFDTKTMDETTFVHQQDVVARTATALGAGGPSAQVSMSCASGAAAVSLALDWLAAGRADRVLVVCYDTLTEYCWCGLANLRTISAEGVHPFDKHRSGTVFSEGAAAMLLAADPGDGLDFPTVLAAATNNNAFHLTAPAKGAAGSARVMAAALAAAGVTPELVDLVSAHATATQANDVTESAALNALLAGRRVPVCAFKGNLGHLLGAAGLAEIVLTVAALRTGQAPPVAGLTDQDSECDVDAVRDVPRPGDYDLALTNSAGIGGNNAATVLAAMGAVVPAPPPRPVYLRRVGWVLPDHLGIGDRLPDLDLAALLAANAALDGFSARDYISSVKGYLDQTAACSLAAAALTLGDDWQPGDTPSDRFGVVGVSQYGAPRSAWRFYELMVGKGHRSASPLVFPHGYANTAPNLVAIEFGLGGAHLVFSNAPDVAEAATSAVHMIAGGAADDLLLLAAEAAAPEPLPDGWQVLNGAVCLWLTADPGGGRPRLPADFAPCRRPANRRGTVHAILEAAGHLHA